MQTGFKQVRQVALPALNLVAHEYEHQPTGARHLHLQSGSAENVFLVALRTVPADSTGVAHILEHTALCGSERYPVRDPFFLMIRRSLNTFMNAFTGSDFTAYPFASQNRKDYFNLMSVYLDSVFRSRLDPLDFAQEGHRLEFAERDNPASPLTFKGVVYNEMKGAMGAPLARLHQGLQERLYPGCTYHHHSGGDPAQIPALSYAALKRFYRAHYHPSNAFFMTYGDIPAEEQQAFIAKAALDAFGEVQGREAIRIAPAARYASPQAAEFAYPVDEEDLGGRAHVALGWLLLPNTDLPMLLRCQLLADLLLDTSASPLRRALETTPLAAAASPLCGFQEDNMETAFFCGVEGADPENAEAIEQLVLQTLEEVASKGVPAEQVEAVLHQLELSQREPGGDGYPYGLQLLMSCLPAAIHQGDPIGILDLDAALAKLRKDVADPAFIGRLVRELLLDNPHRVRVTMKPDRGLAKREAAEEAAALKKIQQGLSQQQAQQIVQQAQQLAERQAQEEDISILPCVTRADIPQEARYPSLAMAESPAGPVAAEAAGTNGLVYHQVVRDLPALAPAQLELLPLYAALVTEVGSAARGYLDTQLLQHRMTGGISAFASLRALPEDASSLRACFTLSSRTLAPKLDAMVALVKDTAEAASFTEPQRVKDLVSQQRARRLNGIAGSGHQYAMQAAAAQLRPAAALNDQLGGIPGILRLLALDASLASDAGLQALCARLAELHEALQKGKSRFLFVAEDSQLQDCQPTLARHWQPAAQPGAATPAPPRAQPSQEPVAYITTTQVNYCAAAHATVSESHPDSAALSLLAGVLRNQYLHTALREKGGAYGGGASHDSSAGIFRFYSYRDPSIQQTFDAFAAAIHWALDGKITEAMLEESLLGVISTLDAPASPAGEIKQAFHHQLFGRTADFRAKARAAHLEVTLPDLRRVAEKYLTAPPAQALITSEARASEAKGFRQTRIA